MNLRRLFSPTAPIARGPDRRRGRPERGARGPRSHQPRRRRRLPWARITAAWACLLLVMVLGGLIGGPWLRVRTVTWAGTAWTPATRLHDLIDPVIGSSLLLVDTAAIGEELAGLPAVERATVNLGLAGDFHAELIEGGAAAVWRTSAAQLLVARDGTVIGIQARDAVRDGPLGELPLVDDPRDTSHDLGVGDAVVAPEMEAALALAALRPSRFGSTVSSLGLEIDATYGLIVTAPQAGWRAAFGFYGFDPAATAQTMAARIESQASAMRTLFATRPETGLAWIDVRNPGRVYFRARG